MIYPRIDLSIGKSCLLNEIFTFFFCKNYLFYEEKIKELIETCDSNDSGFYSSCFLSVRTAFDCILSALNLPEGSEVLMSAINIQDMANIVEKHGLKVIPVDINKEINTLSPSLEDLKQKFSQKSKLFVIADLFGFQVDLEPYRDFCKENSLILIKDKSQGFCGFHENFKEKDTKDIADIVMYSFGPIKSNTALGGSIILFKDYEIFKKTIQIENSFSRLPETWFFKRLVKYLFLKICLIPFVYGVIIKFIKKYTKKDLDSVLYSLVRGFGGTDELFKKIRKRPPASLLKLLYKRIKIFDNSKLMHRQRFILNFLKSKIKFIAGFPIDRHFFWLVPILSNDPESLKKILSEKNFDSSRGTTSLVNLGDEKSCPMTEMFFQKVLYLPELTLIPRNKRMELSELLKEL